MLAHYQSAFREESLSLSAPFYISWSSLGDFPLHWHSSIEIIYMLEGRLGCRINNGDYALDKGDILLINSRDLHAFTRHPSVGNELIMIRLEPSFYKSSGFLPGGKVSPVRQFSKKQYFSQDDPAYQNLKKILDRISEEVMEEDHSSSLLYSSAFLDLLHLFCRLEEDPVYHESHNETERFRDVLGYIAGNFQNEMTLADGAEAACLSPFHFSRVFKEYTGQTFTQYLRTYRIKYACHLLLTTDSPVIDIAYQCGYSSLKTFYRQFKTVEGASPGEIRSGIAKSENI